VLLDVAVHRRTVSVETRQLGETLLEINRGHERLIDGLLLLARSEREPIEPFLSRPRRRGAAGRGTAAARHGSGPHRGQQVQGESTSPAACAF
jgi:hypothetical protein